MGIVVGFTAAVAALVVIWAPLVIGLSRASLVSEVLAGGKPVKTSGELREGGYAPDFQFRDRNGVLERLSDYQGTWAFLYFHARDDSHGCASEAGRPVDRFRDIEKEGVRVLDVSVDDATSRVKLADLCDAPFTLSERNRMEVLRQYGSEWALLPAGARVSFLIDPKGFVARIYDGADPAAHAGDVLRDLAIFKKPI